jgi:hypothetical protein
MVFEAYRHRNCRLRRIDAASQMTITHRPHPKMTYF